MIRRCSSSGTMASGITSPVKPQSSTCWRRLTRQMNV